MNQAFDVASRCPTCALQIKRIQPFTMPLMSLAATALDQPKHRDEVIATMLQVGTTWAVHVTRSAGAALARQSWAVEPHLKCMHCDLAGHGRLAPAHALGIQATPPSVTLPAQYLPTDSVICHDEPGPLADRQKQVGGR